MTESHVKNQINGIFEFCLSQDIPLVLEHDKKFPKFFTFFGLTQFAQLPCSFEGRGSLRPFFIIIDKYTSRRYPFY